MRVLLLAALCACTSPQPPPGSAGPAEAVQDLAAALQKGDTATAWSLLSTRTQKDADAVAARACSVDARVRLASSMRVLHVAPSLAPRHGGPTEAILGMIAHNEEVPVPSPANGRPVVRLPALTAAKLEVHRAMRQAGLDAAQLAQRLGWSPKKITHIFDGYHAVRLEHLEAALAALGRRFVVTSEVA